MVLSVRLVGLLFDRTPCKIFWSSKFAFHRILFVVNPGTTIWHSHQTERFGFVYVCFGWFTLLTFEKVIKKIRRILPVFIHNQLGVEILSEPILLPDPGTFKYIYIHRHLIYHILPQSPVAKASHLPYYPEGGMERSVVQQPFDEWTNLIWQGVLLFWQLNLWQNMTETNKRFEPSYHVFFFFRSQ